MLPYTVVLAGQSRKSEAQKSLPMLNKIISYPTAIFINRQGEIEEIHTGFSGPSTEGAYNIYTAETERLVRTLLK